MIREIVDYLIETGELGEVFDAPVIGDKFFSRIADGWVAEPPDFTVTRLLVDYAFSIEMLNYKQHMIDIRIGVKFVLTVGDVSKSFDPEETMSLGEALIVFNKSLLQMTVYDSGVIQIQFSDGIRIEVQPDDHYEAWELNTPQDDKIVCLPGGGLGIWGPAKSPPESE